MALSDSFRKVAVYFGLAEDREYYDDDEPEIRERAPRPRAAKEEERPNVRRLQSSRRRRDEIDDIFGDDSASERRTTQLRPVQAPRATAAGRSACTSWFRSRSTTRRTSRTSSRTRSR